MTQRTQVARAYTTGTGISGQPEGTPFFNFADLKLQIQGPGGPIDLLPLRLFSDQADYPANSLIYHNSELLINPAPVTAGAFNSNDWTPISQSPFSGVTGALGWDVAITYTADDLADVITYSLASLRVRITFAYTADSLVDTVTYETSNDSGGSWGTPAVMTITYTNGLATAVTWS